jgi:hypothetical protein
MTIKLIRALYYDVTYNPVKNDIYFKITINKKSTLLIWFVILDFQFQWWFQQTKQPYKEAFSQWIYTNYWQLTCKASMHCLQ